MRKIVSKEQEEKKRRRNQLLIGGVLVLIMVASSLGYAFTREQNGTDSNSDKIIYNGYEFTRISNLWYVTKGDYQFSFVYNPNETLKTSSNLNALSNYANKPLYVDTTDVEAASEIYRNVFSQNRIVLRMQNACFEGEKCEENIPVKNCTDNIIVIKESSNGSINQQQNCVFIEGSAENLTKMTDSFLFKITGIQQNL